MTAPIVWWAGQPMPVYAIDEPLLDWWCDADRRPFEAPAGQLWERLAEYAENSRLEVIDDWLVEVEPSCGRCAPPHDCPPGFHETPVRFLWWREQAEYAENHS